MRNLTNEQIKQKAIKYGIEYACLKAVIEVESNGSGFINGLPKILYEPHVMYKLLTQDRWITVRNRMVSEQPKLCYATWGKYPYGRTIEQHTRLSIASKYSREHALQACSWGLGQVMGYHWKSLGYTSLQAFINAMYESEAEQLEAMLRFIEKNGLLVHLKNKDWTRFARGYNGAGYTKNQYHIKLANAYAKYR